MGYGFRQGTERKEPELQILGSRWTESSGQDNVDGGKWVWQIGPGWGQTTGLSHPTQQRRTGVWEPTEATLVCVFMEITQPCQQQTNKETDWKENKPRGGGHQLSPGALCVPTGAADTGRREDTHHLPQRDAEGGQCRQEDHHHPVFQRRHKEDQARPKSGAHLRPVGTWKPMGREEQPRTPQGHGQREA